jgi:hypothetical protein
MAAPPITERHKHHFHRGSPIKESVRVATTANITIATALNNGDTLDGITLATDDRVLVKDQSTGSQNGIYVVAASPARAYDQSTDDPAFGFLVNVRQGTANASTLWRNTNTSVPTIGSTSLTFAQITTGSLAASAVSVLDSLGWFPSPIADVEAALAYLGGLTVGYTAHGNTGSTETFDALTAWHSATLNAATVTFTFTGATSGLLASMVLELAQDGTGGRLVTWPGSVVWPGGVAPTLSVAASAVDILTFFSRDGGTTWYGFPTGGGTGSALTIKDEGSSLATAATSIDFVGAGVVASGTAAAKTVTISGAPTGAAGGDLSGTYPNPSVVDDSHSHTTATAPGGGHGPILLASDHSVPFTFDEILQASDGSDFLYASE